MEIARDPYSMAQLGLIYAKKTPSKISRLGTFKGKFVKKIVFLFNVIFKSIMNGFDLIIMKSFHPPHAHTDRLPKAAVKLIYRSSIQKPDVRLISNLLSHVYRFLRRGLESADRGSLQERAEFADLSFLYNKQLDFSSSFYSIIFFLSSA